MRGNRSVRNSTLWMTGFIAIVLSAVEFAVKARNRRETSLKYLIYQCGPVTVYLTDG